MGLEVPQFARNFKGSSISRWDSVRARRWLDMAELNPANIIRRFIRGEVRTLNGTVIDV